MTDKEKKILETFKEAIPKLSEEQKEKLVWFGEGMAFKKDEKEDKDKQPA